MSFARGQAAYLGGVERLLNLLRARFYVERRPIGVLAAIAGGDVPAEMRQRQHSVYRFAIASATDFRDRALAVARGASSIEGVNLVEAAINSVRSAQAASRADYEIVMHQVDQVREGASRPKRPLCTWDEAEHAGVQADSEIEWRSAWAQDWAFGPGTSEAAGGGVLGTWKDAEVAAARHMRVRLGFTDAATTPPGTDNGIDVRSSRAVAQVKHYSAPVGQPDLQRLVGANEGGQIAVFYALSGFSSKAVDFADRNGVALFRFDPPREPSAVNVHAKRLLGQPVG